MKIKLLCLIVLFCSTAAAEYRVFKLQITNTKTKQVRTIQSTLDPVQYRGIYQPENSTITYVQTWRCPGRTDQFKEHCPAPSATPAISPVEVKPKDL